MTVFNWPPKVESIINNDGFLSISPETGHVIIDIDLASLNGILDHGDLAGLGDDDHTQYLNTSRHSDITSNPHGVTFTEAVAADGGTDISAAEAETLTDASNADALHTHSFAANAFTTINAPSGTDPIADSPTDTLNLITTDSSLIILGTASTDTIDFEINLANTNIWTALQTFNAGIELNDLDFISFGAGFSVTRDFRITYNSFSNSLAFTANSVAGVNAESFWFNNRL